MVVAQPSDNHGFLYLARAFQPDRYQAGAAAISGLGRVKCYIWPWSEGELSPTLFPGYLKRTRIVTCQPVRVFFISRVMLKGLNHIVSPPSLRAWLMPQPEQPISSDTPLARCRCFCPQNRQYWYRHLFSDLTNAARNAGLRCGVIGHRKLCWDAAGMRLNTCLIHRIRARFLPSEVRHKVIFT